MSDDTPTRVNVNGRGAESEAERLVRLEMTDDDHQQRIRRLEKDMKTTQQALADGSVSIALIRRDVRNIMWLVGTVAVAVIGAIVTAIAKLMEAGPI